MKANLLQNLRAWLRYRRESKAERRHRRALLREDRREKRELQRLWLRLAATPPRISAKRPEVSSLVYNISVKPPKISKSAAEQIGLGRKFELVEARRERTETGAVVYLTLHWKSPKKARYSFSFDIAEPAPDLLGVYLCGAPPLPLKQRPAVGIIPRTEPWDISKELRALRELEASPEARAAREKLANLIFQDVEETMRAAGKRLEYGPFLKPTK